MTANSPLRIAVLPWFAPSSLLLAARFATLPAALLAPLSVSLPAASAQAPPRVHSHEFRHEIEQVEDAWRAAVLKGDSVALGSLLAEDYTGITARGAIQTKQQAIENLRSGAFQLSSLSTSDRKVRLYGATAVVTSMAELTGTRKDLDVSGRYRYTRVYVRNPQGQWKIVSFEASRVQEPNEHK
jgi:ketosteroid isomerase-like protein